MPTTFASSRPSLGPALSRVLPALLGLVLVTASCFAQASQDSDRWFMLKMMGAKCGDLHTTVVTKDGKITTHSVTNIAISRGGGDALKIAMETEFVETEDGKPVSMKSLNSMGGAAGEPVSENFTFQEDGSIKLITEQAGAKKEKVLPKPTDVWLTPAAADRFVRQRVKSGAKEITLRTIDPSMGAEPVSTKYSDFQPTTLTIEGKKVEATKRTVTVTLSGAPMKTTEYVDGDGELIKSRMDLGALAIDVIATTEALATKKSGAAPEVMVNTFAKPDKAINDPRHVSKAVLLLSIPEDAMPALPSTGSQQVEKVEKATRVTITTQDLTPATEADAADAKFLASSTMLDIDSKEIKDLAAKAIEGAEDSPAARAEACRRFVYRFIKKKSLGVAFATASQVARKPEGDCTEHGVLLAALLRANKIPARGVIGLIYADEFAGAQGIFGYHMWAQALLEVDGKPRWVDLDATLPRSTPYDATHITLDTTDLADGSPSAGLAAIASLLGRLEIKVESIEHAAKKPAKSPEPELQPK